MRGRDGEGTLWQAAVVSSSTFAPSSDGRGRGARMSDDFFDGKEEETSFQPSTFFQSDIHTMINPDSLWESMTTFGWFW
jgi:hypothetical protein